MKLIIAEGLYLIALDDEEGRLLAAAEKSIVPALLSAIVLELYIQKKVSLADAHITVLDSAGTGNGILDNVLFKLHSGAELIPEIKKLEGEFKDLMGDFNQLLAQRAILRKEET